MTHVIANKVSKIYHAPSCYLIKDMLGVNKVEVDDKGVDSDGRVYRPCCRCFPKLRVVELLNNSLKGLI